MKLKLAEYTFPENKASIAVFSVRDEEGVISEDCLSLEFSKLHGEKTEIYMRPDEALLIITLLSQGLNRSVINYEISPDPDLY